MDSTVIKGHRKSTCLVTLQAKTNAKFVIYTVPEIKGGNPRSLSIYLFIFKFICGKKSKAIT